MASVTLEQKRLEQLKQQLFGKSDSTPVKITSQKLKELNSKDTNVSSTISLQSFNLKSDLLKILLFSAAALAIQFSLFFAIRNNLIRFF